MGGRMNSSPRLALLNPALQSRPQDVEFGFTHCPFQTEQQPVIEVSRIIDPVFVKNQRVGEGADLEQPMPVHRVSCQPGDLETEYDAGPSEADLRDQALKTLTVGGGSSGLAEVGID